MTINFPFVVFAAATVVVVLFYSMHYNNSVYFVVKLR